MAVTVEGTLPVKIEGVAAGGGRLPVSVGPVAPVFTATADRSGEITTGGTAQVAIPYRSHLFFMIQNVSDNPMWINLMGGTSAGPDKIGSYYLAPLSPPFRMENVVCEVSVFSEATGARWSASIDYTGDGEG